MAESKTKKAVKSAAKTTGRAVKNTGNAVANNPMKAVYIVGGIALLVLGYKIVNRIPAPKTLPDVDADPTQPSSTLSDAQAKVIADRLYAAMSGLGTDEDAIYAALDPLNVNDFVKVYNAFGLRQYSLSWGNVGDPITSDDHDLITWLTNELNADEIQYLESIVEGLSLKQ